MTANLDRALAGVDTLYVTYWMRFPRGHATWAEIVANVARLAAAARRQGVRRLVYISVSNARHDSSTAYFRAKAAAEDAVRAAVGDGLSMAVVRPTLLYGPSDILINNMAWSLRRLPVFGIPGDGRYRVQPVHVDDVADLAIRLGAGSDHTEVDAAGPETFTFDELVRLVRSAVRSRALSWSTCLFPSSLARPGCSDWWCRDVVLTRDEIRELMESLLTSRCEPRGHDARRASASGSPPTRRTSAGAGPPSSPATFGSPPRADSFRDTAIVTDGSNWPRVARSVRRPTGATLTQRGSDGFQTGGTPPGVDQLRVLAIVVSRGSAAKGARAIRP